MMIYTDMQTIYNYRNTPKTNIITSNMMTVQMLIKIYVKLSLQYFLYLGFFTFSTF